MTTTQMMANNPANVIGQQQVQVHNVASASFLPSSSNGSFSNMLPTQPVYSASQVASQHRTPPQQQQQQRQQQVMTDQQMQAVLAIQQPQPPASGSTGYYSVPK